MKQIFVSTAFAMAFAVMATGCASETTEGSGEFGSVGLNIVIAGEDVTSVAFEITGDAGTLSGNLNVNDENDPPIAATVMDLPPGPYTVRLTASDAQGAVLCTGSTEFTVVANTTVDANVVLQCGVTGEELLGNVNITGEFEFLVTNRCPRLHFLNAVPDEVPAEGSEVTVLVSDADGDTLTTALTATGGSFADPSARPNTTYFCDGAAGAQTISVTVTDGDAACDKSKSFEVTCPGDNPCDGVECPDTGNQCTVGICTDQSAPDCVETNVENGLACDAGGIVDLADNGGLEEGSFNGWLTDFCDGTSPDSRGVCELSDMAATGDFAARLFNDQPASASVLKQANKGIGIVQPGDTVTITFAAKGVGVAGGVAFAEFFSEIEGGGTSDSVLLGNAPLSLLPDQYQPFSFTVTAGPNVSGGVTLQFAAVTGGDAGSTMELFVDDVAITFEGGGAGTCQDGACVPDDLCDGVICDDQNECTIDTCAGGNCSFTPDVGASCDGGAGACDAAGVCQANDLCEGNTCDDEDTECSDSSCDAGTGECVATPINEGGDCDGGTGNCSARGFCVPNPTANAFIKTLDPGAGFQVSLIDTVDTTNLPDTWGGYAASISIPDNDAFIGHVLQFGFQTNASDFDSSGNFYDNVGLNDPTVLYTQDFNGLDITGAVIGDGWTFFNNVFDGAGTRKFGYGGAAPNGPQICALAADEGGPQQNPQQLSVYSDYECCGPGTTNEGHFNGTDLVETNVFQERVIGADDLGKTFEFIFEAKAGNIGQ